MSSSSHNVPCPCGSGKKYEDCCLVKNAAIQKPVSRWGARQHYQTDSQKTTVVLGNIPSFPDPLTYYGNMGNTLLGQGNLDMAIENYRRALEIKPDFAEVHCNMGFALQTQGNLDAAIESYRKALALKPDFAGAHSNLGLALQAQGNLDAAINSYRKAIALKPDFADTHYNLGIVLRDMGKLDEAVASYHQALSLQPNFSEAYYNLGNVLQDQGKLDVAAGSYRKALSLKPDYAEAHNNLGNVLLIQGELDAAIACYQQAVALKPDFAEAHNSLGTALTMQGKLDAAIESYRGALLFKPDYAEAHNNLSLALLLRGAFHEGWREYEWRIRGQSGNAYITDPRDSSLVLPQPSSLLPLELNGKRILLVPDQGIGDELFFLRFARIARQRGAWTAYQPSAKIATIVQRAPGLDMVVSGADIPPDMEQIFSVGDLPLILGADHLNDIPPALPLTALPDRVSAMRDRLAALGKGPFLGVTWRAGTERRMGSRRTALFKGTDIPMLGRALSAWSGEVLILQRNPRPEELESFTHALGRPTHDLSDLNENLEDMLALLSLLDEYVGVSNTNMHLMAGLGKTARVLIPHPPDWRWMREGTESPWFPGFQLYREKLDGGWSAAFAHLTEELHKVALMSHVQQDYKR